MPELILSCPRCERALRVTDDLAGKPVKCPACAMIFMASTAATAPGEPPPARVIPEASSPPAQVHEEQTRSQAVPRPTDTTHAAKERAAWILMPPAIGLLICGTLGILVNLAQIALIALGVLPVKPEKLPPEWRALADGGSPEFAAVIAIVFAIVSLIVVVGAIQMLRWRMYPLALVASIFAILDLGNCCCVIAAPFGVWSLVVLLRQDVQKLFSVRSNETF